MNAYAFPGIKYEYRIHVKNLEAQEIIKKICAYFQENIEDVQKLRQARYVYVRDWCMFFLTTNTALSLKEIGSYFHNRDHSTVIHAREKIKNNLKDERYTFHKRYMRDYGELLILLENEENKNN